MGAIAREVAMVAAVLLTACLPDGKESLELPPPASDLRAESVGQLGDGDDVRNLRRHGDLLLATDRTGLLIYDVATPAAPVLLARTGDGPVDHVAAAGDSVYLIEIGDDRVRQFDIRAPAAPVAVAQARSLTRTFGGIDADDNQVWHAVGSSPPSRVFLGDSLSLDRSCLADDQERGIMGVWLFDGLTVLSVHFDDFGGDGFDGNGGFGFALLDVTSPGGQCPEFDVTDIVLAQSHGLNRSTFEEPSNSDLQAAFDAGSRELFTTGEQRLRRFRVGDDGIAALIGEVIVPEALDVALEPDATVAGIANGDFVLVEVRARGALLLANAVATDGIARAVVAAGDGEHFYVADGEAGIAIIRYGAQP